MARRKALKPGAEVEYDCKVHHKRVTGVVEFVGENHCIVVYRGGRFSVGKSQLKITG